MNALINFNDNKTRRIIAAVIVVLIIAAMVVPMVLGYLV